MFLCASSADNRDKNTIDDFASVFSTDLTQPIKLKDFTIELVNCVITTEKNIKISESTSKLVLTVGPTTAAEQYIAKLPVGVYTTAEFSPVIVEAINSVLPCQGNVTNSAGGSGFSCAFNNTSKKFELEYTRLAQNNNDIDKFIKPLNVDTFGYDVKLFNNTVDDTKAEIDFLFGGDAELNNEPYETSESRGLGTVDTEGSVVGLDVGGSCDMNAANPEEDIDGLTYVGLQETGIAENGGVWSAMLKPVPCSIDTNYNKPIGGADVNLAPYFVVDDNTEGTPYDSSSFEESLLYWKSGTTVRTDRDNKRYVSGVLCNQPPALSNDTRGLPYTLGPAELVFPPLDNMTFNAGGGEPTQDCYRHEFIRSTWNNSFRMTENVGRTDVKFSSYNHFDNRGFNLELDTGLTTNINSSAFSSLSTTDGVIDGVPKEPLSFRLAVKPLITGLLQSQADGTTAQSYIKPSTILTPQSDAGGVVIEYILGSVGQMNSLEFAGSNNVLATTSGGTNRRLPYYKITKIDAATKRPAVVVLTDGGENINVGTSLFLNDPATFNITANPSNVDDDTILTTMLSFATPQAIDVGICPLRYTTRRQYLPTNLSLTNDMIFSNIIERKTDKYEQSGGDPLSADFSKDFELIVLPLDSTPGAGGGTIRFQVNAFQPNSTTFPTEASISRAFFTNPETTKDMKQLLFDASPADWNTSVVYAPVRAAPDLLTNWAGFNQNTAVSRIKIQIKLNNFFEYEAVVSYSTDSGASFTDECSLIKTFETATVTNAGVSTVFAKSECTLKSRLLPLHPGLASMPGVAGINPNGLNTIEFRECRLADYSKAKNKKPGMSYYGSNIFNIPEFSTIPSIFDFPTNQTIIDGPVLQNPPIMLKFGSNILVDNTAPSTPAVEAGALPQSLIAPANFQSSSQPTGFDDCYICDSTAYSVSNVVQFIGSAVPTTLPFINTFVVELNNIPAEGFITQAYTIDGTKKGNGAALPIVGVVPYLEERNTDATELKATLRYSSPYSQPVLIKLPTERYLYNFDFRLRNIETNEYLKNLENPTELIFRLNPM